MTSYFLYFISVLMLLAPAWAWAEEQQPQAPTEISQEDLQVINMLETLELMEMAERIEFLKDMDILIEPEGKENDED